MSEWIEQPRSVCALGSLHTVLAIDNAVPILHSGQGCATKLSGAVSVNNGFQGKGRFGGLTLPCTKIGESEVVFGGENKLSATIENALKVMDADLYVVVTSCVPEIVGDDVAEVVKRFKGMEKPVIYAETGGFNGSNYIGHEAIVGAIIDQYLKPSEEREDKLVNIWGPVPYQDPFWMADYEELEKLVSELGLIPNIIFGSGRGLAELDKVPKAALNLLVSPWVGFENVKHMERKFGTPYLHYKALPVGPTETGRFLRTLGEKMGVRREHTEAVIEKNESYYYRYLERGMEILFELRSFPRTFVSVTNSLYGLGISRFLINDLGFVPGTQYITDGAPEEYQRAIMEEYKMFEGGLTADVYFSNDGGEVQEKIRNSRFDEKILLLGTAWEALLSKDIDAFHLSVSMPVSERLVFNTSYVGYRGALRLVEDIFAVISNAAAKYYR